MQNLLILAWSIATRDAHHIYTRPKSPDEAPASASLFVLIQTWVVTNSLVLGKLRKLLSWVDLLVRPLPLEVMFTDLIILFGSRFHWTSIFRHRILLCDLFCFSATKGAGLGAVQAAWEAKPLAGNRTLPLLVNTANRVGRSAGALGTGCWLCTYGKWMDTCFLVLLSRIISLTWNHKSADGFREVGDIFVVCLYLMRCGTHPNFYWCCAWPHNVTMSTAGCAAVFQATKCIAVDARGKDDFISSAFAGCAAGSTLALSCA